MFVNTCKDGITRKLMKGTTRGLREGWMEGKLSEVNARTESRRLVGKFKMAASDLVGVRGQVMEYMYIPTGIKR